LVSQLDLRQKGTTLNLYLFLGTTASLIAFATLIFTTVLAGILIPVKTRPAPKAHAPPAGYVLDHFSQLPMNEDHLYRDPDYPWDAYF
jgi:hypothetical protein